MAHRRFSRGSGSRRLSTWISNIDVGGMNINFGGVASISEQEGVFFGTSSAEDLTVVRTRGTMSAKFTNSVAPDFPSIVSLGIGIIPERTAITGAFGSTPSAGKDASWDGWWFHETWALSVDPADPNALEGLRESQVDSKAMRKISPDEVIFASVAVFNNSTISTLAVQFNASFRALIKLA